LRRTQIYIVIGFCVFVFLAISFLLARALGATNNERARVLEIAKAEAQGDADAVLRATPACQDEPACADLVREFVAKLKRPGEVQILQYRPAVQLPLTTVTGTGRLAWRAGTSRPVIQCVSVHREGPLSGATVEVLSISAPIGDEASCPG
jgi:hypothetical protein